MKRFYTILMDPGTPPGGGGGGADKTLITDPPPDWRAGLSEEFKAEPSLASFKTVNDLAKSYVSAAKMVGVDRMPAPTDKWTDADWSGLFDRLGRPKTSNDYPEPQTKLKDGLVLDKEVMTKAKENFYKIGLTGKQASSVLDFYYQHLNTEFEKASSGVIKGKEAALSALGQEWGKDYETNIAVAKSTLSRLVDKDFVQYLEETGLGNDVRLIKAFHRIGLAISEDASSSNMKSLGSLPDSKTQALQRIQQMKTDPDIVKAMRDSNHPANKALKEEWTAMHKAAYPS